LSFQPRTAPATPVTARALAVEIWEQFGDSRAWLALCDQGLPPGLDEGEPESTDPTGLRWPFADLTCGGEHDRGPLARLLGSIDRNGPALGVVAGDYRLTSLYFEARELLARGAA